MSKSILFVCQSCHIARPKPPDRPHDGAILFDHLLTLHQTWSRRSQLDIQPVGCLWTCSHPCAIVLGTRYANALSCPNKFTYFLANVPGTDAAEAILQLSEQYLDSQDGSLPWKRFPEVLKTDIVAQIPPFLSLQNQD